MQIKNYKSRISRTFLRYAVMAVVVVGIEIFSFWVLNTPLRINYLLATILSLSLGILLNWVGSRYFAFGKSKHDIHKELLLVVITSLFGVVLQTATVYISVEKLKLLPLTGKCLAIVITFFWNYYIRKKYIYNQD